MLDKAVESKYALEAPTFQCVGCEAEISKGDSYFSAVFFMEEVFQRQEKCVRCWEERAEAREQAFAYWKTMRPMPDTVPPAAGRPVLHFLDSYPCRD